MMNKKMLCAGLCSALLASGLGACGNLTAGGLTGEATVIVSGDVDTLSATPPLAPSVQRATAAPATAEGTAPALVGPLGVAQSGPAMTAEEAEGEIEVKFLAYLVAEGGAVMQLGTEEIEVSVDLRGRDEMDVVDRQRIPVGRYTELRLIFTRIEAQVEGLVIDGIAVPQVHVDLKDLSLLVSRAIDLDVTAGLQADLVVDLNTLAWLDAVDPNTGGVDESVFQDLVNVVIR